MPARPLSPGQQRYVESRLRQIRWWNRLGWLILAVLAAGYAWLWREHRLLVDPQLLLEKLRLGAVDQIDIARLAALGNLAFLACGVLIAGMVLLTYAAMLTEAATIRRLTRDAPPDSPDVPETETHDEHPNAG